jgi:hypothetical protein
VKELPGLTAMHGCDYGLFRLILGVLVMREMERSLAREKEVEDEEEGGRVGEEAEEKRPKPTPTACVDDLVSHKKYCAEKWLNAVQKGGKNTIYIYN